METDHATLSTQRTYQEDEVDDLTNAEDEEKQVDVHFALQYEQQAKVQQPVERLSTCVTRTQS